MIVRLAFSEGAAGAGGPADCAVADDRDRVRKAIESCTDREKLPEIWAYALVIPFSPLQFSSLYQYICVRGRELAVDPALLPPPPVQA